LKINFELPIWPDAFIDHEDKFGVAEVSVQYPIQQNELPENGEE